MKKYIELEINGQKVALALKDLPFLLTYRIASELGDVAGSSADRFIDLPPSKETNNLYQQFSEVASSNKEAFEYKDTTVKANGVPIFSGVSQLQRAVLSGKGRPYKREVKSYKVGLFGDNADWLIKLKNLKIRDLDWTDQTWDSPTVQNGWNAAFDSGDYFGFCAIKWRTWNNETAGTSTPYSVSLELEEFTPFLFIRSIIEKAFDYIGWTLASNYLTTKRLKSLIYPVPPIEKYPQDYSEDYFNVTLQTTLNTLVASPVPPANILLGYTAIKVPPVNPLVFNPATSTYTVLFDGYIQMTVNHTVDSITGNAPQSAIGYFQQTGSVSRQIAVYAFGTLISGPAVAAGQTSSGSGVFNVAAGDTLQLFELTTEGAGPGSFTFSGTIDFQCEALFTFGQPIIWKYLLGDYKVIDIINDLTLLHGLRFEANNTLRTLKIEPRNDYIDTDQVGGASLESGFFESSSNNDYTPKLDFLQDAELSKINSKQNQVFKWETDGDTEGAIEQNEQRGIYEAAYILQDNTFIDEDETRTTKFFAKTISIFEKIIQSDPQNVSAVNITPLIPIIFPQNYIEDDEALEANYNVKPRILHFFGQRGGLDGYIQVSGVGDIELPAAFFVNYNDTTGLDPSLSWANEVINGISVPGLLDAFWIHYMVTLSHAKTLKEFIYWKPTELNRLTFTDTLLIDSVRYILKEIQDFDPTSDRSTKTVLEPFYLASSSDSDNIDNTALSGVVNLFP